MSCLTPYTTKDGNKVPCGRCPVCLENRAAQWVFRLQKEQEKFIASHFVTFTYAPEFVPKSPNGHLTLKPSDMQKFMKRLRKVEGDGIKYYTVGEYGSTKGRPHYHAIIFGVSNPDLYQELWGYKINGKPFGEVYIDEVNGNTCGYVAGYLQKGRAVPAFKNDDRVREFSHMSKGLGLNYLTKEMIKFHLDDLDRVYVQSGARKLAMPRYYRKKIYEDNGIDMSGRQLELSLKSIQADLDRENDYYKKYPDRSHLDYTEIKNERRKAAYTNMVKQQKAKNKLL